MLLLISVLFLTGCIANAPKQEQDPNLNINNSAHFFIYRPSDDVFGLAIELRVFINDKFVGTLNSGGSDVERLVPPGPTKIEVKPYFIGIQDGKIATAELSTTAGDVHYLRLVQDSGIPVVIGHATTFIGADKGLVKVSEESWNQRK